jgi:hypothetical protein
MRKILYAGIVSAALLGLLTADSSLAQNQSSRAPDPPVRIDVVARPIEAFDARDTARKRFGLLEFRGGIELTSPHKEFGGISAIRIAADGERFLAVSDKGRWLRGRLVYRGEHLSGIADAEMAPVLGPDGRAITARGWYDTESITEDGGAVYLGLERVNRILRFDYARHGLLARGQPVAVPPDLGKLPNNAGLECLTAIPKPAPNAGTLIAISERALDDAGNIKAFLIGGPTPGTFTVARSDNYDITDCAAGPGGDLYVLERRFSWAAGVAMRVRYIPLAAVVPGAVLDGKVLITADMGYQIDNMEGLAVHRTKGGETVLTMVSDDNFSFIQRTILLQFAVAGE